jgi:hypothetical protein
MAEPYSAGMSERLLEVARQPDGRFLAIFHDGEPAVEVLSWDDIRQLRDKRHLVDHWAGDDREAFIEQYGHPFDDWWAELSPACAEALMADPAGAVPAPFQDEVKRSLRHQAKQSGLGMDGSSLTPEARAFVALQAVRTRGS